MKIRTLVGGLLAVGATQATAADWSFDPRVGAAYVYNDNHRLTDVEGTEIDVSGASLDAQLAMRAATQRSLFLLTPRLRSTFFPSDESEEADDQFVRMFARHATERTLTSLDVDYSRVVTLGYYFPEANVTSDDVLGDPDRGVGLGQSGRNRQDRLVLTPRFAFDVAERQRLHFQVEYLDVTYDEQVPGDRVDFENVLFAAGYRYALTETSAIMLQGGYATYDPADGNSTEVQGLNAEWRNVLSDTAEIYVRAGANRVESISNSGKSSWDTGFSGGTGVRWTFEVSDVWLDASTSLDPDSSGDIVTRDQVRLQFTRRLGPMTRLTLAGRVMKDTGAGDAEATFDDRTYATGNVGLEWRFAKQWSVSGSYNYQWREYDEADTDAESNAFIIGIAWEPNRR